MHSLATLPPDFWVTVVIILGGVFMVILISFADAQAKGGWSSFVKRYPAQARPTGSSHRVPSWTYCNVHWRAKGLRVIFTDTGIYFYKTFLSRLAHPPFLLPWESVKRVEKRHGFLGEYYILEIEDAAGKIQLDLPKRVEYEFARYQKIASHDALSIKH